MKARILGTVILAGALAGSATGAALAAPAAAPAAAPTTTAASAPNKATASKARPGTAFTAYGSSWREVVDRGTLRFEGPTLRAGHAKVTRSAWAKGVQFSGKSGGRNVSLIVRNGRCVDVTGTNTGMRATFVHGKKVYRGCAVSGALPAVG